MWWHRKRERDLERELEAHLELEAEEQRDPIAARRMLGNLARVKEDTRAAWGWTFLERLSQDIGYAVRVLRHSPGFAAVAVISLALGIGANTALFSALDAVMWKSLPVRHPENLRVLTTAITDATKSAPSHSHTGYSYVDENTRQEIRSSFSFAMYQALRDHVPQFTDLVGFSDNQFTVGALGSSEFVPGWFVSGNYFAALGVAPAAGRLIWPEDDAPGKAPVAVITHRYWEKRFGSDPSVIGREVTINQTRATIIGVAPPAFLGLDPGQVGDLFVPLSMAPAGGPWYSLTDPGTWWVQIFGRLRDGETDASAAASVQAIFAGAIHDYHPTLGPNEEMPRVRISAGAKGIGRFRSRQDSLFLLRDAAGAVLLIACFNLAGLMLARVQARRREIAVRLSIGASRARLIRQLLTESLVLSGIAGALGALVAAPLLELVIRVMGGARGMDIRIDERTLLFTLAASILTGLLFGTLPAWRATRVDLNPALKEGAAASGGRESRLVASRLLVTAQVGFSIVMLTGAGLCVRTLVNLLSVDLGFRTDGLLTFQTRGSLQKEQLAELYARMRAGIEAIPGVESVGMSRHGVLEGGESDSSFYLPGEGNLHGSVHTQECSDSFMATLRIPALAGRGLSPRDGPDAPKVAVVNQAFVKRYLPNVDPLGQVLVFGGRDPSPDDVPVQIVGVARDAHYTSVREAVPPTAYVPYSQDLARLAQLTFVIRTTVPPLSLASAVRRSVATIDPNVPVVQLRTMQDCADESIGRERLMAELVSGFGVLAALLAAIGIFGVMAYTVARRNREIGIRIALGATTSRVRSMVLWDSAVMILAGLAAGIPSAVALSRLTASLLFGVKPHDAWSFTVAAVLMTAAGAVAAWLPARRASRVDPMVTLRSE